MIYTKRRARHSRLRQRIAKLFAAFSLPQLVTANAYGGADVSRYLSVSLSLSRSHPLSLNPPPLHTCVHGQHGCRTAENNGMHLGGLIKLLLHGHLKLSRHDIAHIFVLAKSSSQSPPLAAGSGGGGEGGGEGAVR